MEKLRIINTNCKHVKIDYSTMQSIRKMQMAANSNIVDKKYLRTKKSFVLSEMDLFVNLRQTRAKNDHQLSNLSNFQGEGARGGRFLIPTTHNLHLLSDFKLIKI